MADTATATEPTKLNDSQTHHVNCHQEIVDLLRDQANDLLNKATTLRSEIRAREQVMIEHLRDDLGFDKEVRIQLLRKPDGYYVIEAPETQPSASSD